MNLPTINPLSADDVKRSRHSALLVLGGDQFAALTAEAAVKCGVLDVKVLVPEKHVNAVAAFSPLYKTEPFPKFSMALDEHVGSVTALGSGMVGDYPSKLVHHVYHKSYSITIAHPDSILSLMQQDAWRKPNAPSTFVFDQEIAATFIGEKIDRQFTWQQRTTTVDRYCENTPCTAVGPGTPAPVRQGVQQATVDVGGGYLQCAGAVAVQVGIIAGLSSNYMLAPFPSAHLGTYLFGLAGEYAAVTHSEYGVTARAILDHLPDAFLAYKRAKN